MHERREWEDFGAHVYEACAGGQAGRHLLQRLPPAGVRPTAVSSCHDTSPHLPVSTAWGLVSLGTEQHNLPFPPKKRSEPP